MLESQHSLPGIEVDKAKTDLIVNLPSPTCVQVVRPFLRHVGFYCHFIKDFNKIAKPLTNLLAKDIPFHFYEECYVMLFTKLEETLTLALIFHPPIWGEPFELMCNASDYAVEVVLERVDKKPHIIYYASHNLNDAQLNYIVTEKEFLGVIFGLKKL